MIRVEIKPLPEIRKIIGKPPLIMEVSEGTTIHGLLGGLIETHGPELESVLIDQESGEIKSHYMMN